MSPTSRPVPSTEGAAPPSGQTFVPEVATQNAMAQIAQSRRDLWLLVHELLSPPTREMVDRLRQGRVSAELTAAIEWLADEAARFLPVQMTLDTYVRRARRTTQDQDLQALIQARSVTELRDLPWLPVVLQVGEQCHEEAQAWHSQDHEQAKALRVQEQGLVEEHLADEIPRWAAGVDVSATAMIYRSIARLAVTHLSFETGRDFERTVYGPHSLFQPGNGT